MTATPVLDRQFLAMRAKLLELAADFDRLERSGELAAADPRLTQLEEAVATLRESGSQRAEKIQHVFSRDYDPQWRSQMNL
ncbi:MAG TPA: hypothetical protein ENJ50_10690 [Planctomycetaceae bacterium]|nr:hypothetical protein [Planctomycetaceae bacterium]